MKIEIIITTNQNHIKISHLMILIRPKVTNIRPKQSKVLVFLFLPSLCCFFRPSLSNTTVTTPIPNHTNSLSCLVSPSTQDQRKTKTETKDQTTDQTRVQDQKPTTRQTETSKTKDQRQNDKTTNQNRDEDQQPAAT